MLTGDAIWSNKVISNNAKWQHANFTLIALGNVQANVNLHWIIVQLGNLCKFAKSD